MKRIYSRQNNQGEVKIPTNLITKCPGTQDLAKDKGAQWECAGVNYLPGGVWRKRGGEPGRKSSLQVSRETAAKVKISDLGFSIFLIIRGMSDRVPPKGAKLEQGKS